ncbi:MAG: CvpA family protein [Roseburia sp.]|jgi:uncharacterized membrane protein required for colicin V production|nr:CvpA family protein [Roseburia sp.]
MNWVLIVVLLVFAGCICMGYRRGFLRLAYSLVSWILMFMIVSWATPYISRYIFEHTSIYEQVAAHCEEVIHQTAEERAGEQADSQEQKLQDLGIQMPDNVMEDIVERVTRTADQFMEESGIYTQLAREIAVFVTQGIAFLAALVIAWLMISIISHLLGIVSRIPVLKGINRFLGLFAGGVYGLLMVWVAFAVIAVCGAGSVGQTAGALIRESRLLAFLYDNNPILFLLMRYL